MLIVGARYVRSMGVKQLLLKESVDRFGQVNARGPQPSLNLFVVAERDSQHSSSGCLTPVSLAPSCDERCAFHVPTTPLPYPHTLCGALDLILPHTLCGVNPFNELFVLCADRPAHCVLC